MELIIEIITYMIVAILIGICGAWIYLIKSMDRDIYIYTISG